MLIPKRKRVVDPEHLKRIRRMPCCVCDWPDSQAHHIIGGKDSGMGYKTDDTNTIPLCAACHGELHLIGHVSWEALYGKQTDHLKRLKRRGLIK